MTTHNTQLQQTRPVHVSAAPEATTPEPQVKWSGKAVAELKSCKAEEIWPLWADFINFQKWFPNLASCELVEGEAGAVGAVRLCVGKEGEKWGKERLVVIDDEKRLMRYEVIENNLGLKGYEAEIRVMEVEGGGGCMVQWRFEAEPVEGWGEEGIQRYVQTSLEAIVKRMEQALPG